MQCKITQQKSDYPRNESDDDNDDGNQQNTIPQANSQVPLFVPEPSKRETKRENSVKVRHLAETSK